MKEKIAVRLEEIQVLTFLSEMLDKWEGDARTDMASYDTLLKMKFPVGDYDKDCWNYRQRERCKVKLVAYENIRAVILKAMG